MRGGDAWCVSQGVVVVPGDAGSGVGVDVVVDSGEGLDNAKVLASG